MKVETKVFGTIEIDDNKIIHFPDGLIGYPGLTQFTIIYDSEGETKDSVSWLQCLNEPLFALPVINPLMVKEDYDPFINDEWLKHLGDLKPENTCILVSLSVTEQVEQMAVNLKAPIVINIDEKKGNQVVVENDCPVHFEIYEILKKKKEKEGE